MNANSAVKVSVGEQMGVMVRSGTSAFVYWAAQAPGPRELRVTDLSGKPAAQLLDGCGIRIIELSSEQSSAYVENLLPGHLYAVDLGTLSAAGFAPVMSAAPVQTPWLAHPDDSRFPHPYSRS